MHMADLGDVRLHYRIDGPEDGAPVVFANSLGTDMRLWDPILPLLPAGLRILRYDKRGHGLSTCPAGPYAMGTLVSDVERLMEHTGFAGACFVGLSIGGLIAQGLAVKRLDLVRGLVLLGTAARIGFPAHWHKRIAAVQAGGMAAVAAEMAARWFPRNAALAADWAARLGSMSPEGFCHVAGAIAGADFYTPTSGLRLPLLAIAGAEDGATPPDMMRETADLVPGSRFELVRRAGHLVPVEAPDACAALMSGFLGDIGHLP